MSVEVLGGFVFAGLVFCCLPSHWRRSVSRVIVTGGWSFDEAGVRRARFGGYRVEAAPFPPERLTGFQFALVGGLTCLALQAFIGVDWVWL